MNRLDNQIIRSAKRLEQRECTNYTNGSCLLDECPCYAVTPAYGTIHDGVISCDYFLKAVQPLEQELNIAVWHEVRKERQVKAGKYVSVAKNPSFQPAIGSATALSAGKKLNKPEAGKNNAAVAQEREIRVALPFRTGNRKKNRGFPGTHTGKDDLLVILPYEDEKMA